VGRRPLPPIDVVRAEEVSMEEALLRRCVWRVVVVVGGRGRREEDVDVDGGGACASVCDACARVWGVVVAHK
jgi:hypothetical protein